MTAAEDIRMLVTLRMQQARECLAEARTLMDAGHSPRSIINRSYYAMFYAAMAALQSRQLASSKHTGVLGLFDREFVVTGKLPKELSRNYHRAFDLRQASDYDAACAVDHDMASALLRNAQQLVDAVATLLAE